MQPLEAIQLAALLRQRMPTVTDQELDAVTKAILPFEVEIVFESIEAHAAGSNFVDVKLLINQIADQSRKHSASASARFEGERRRISSRMEKLAEDRRQANEDRLRAGEIVDALSTQDRNRLKAEVLRDLPFIKGFGLIRHIADRAQQQGLHLQKRN